MSHGNQTERSPMNYTLERRHQCFKGLNSSLEKVVTLFSQQITVEIKELMSVEVFTSQLFRVAFYFVSISMELITTNAHLYFLELH